MGCERTGVPITFADRQDFVRYIRYRPAAQWIQRSPHADKLIFMLVERTPMSVAAQRVVLRPLPSRVLTLSSLEQLSELEPESRFDARRFRMNIIVGTSAASIR